MNITELANRYNNEYTSAYGEAFKDYRDSRKGFKKAYKKEPCDPSLLTDKKTAEVAQKMVTKKQLSPASQMSSSVQSAATRFIEKRTSIEKFKAFGTHKELKDAVIERLKEIPSGSNEELLSQVESEGSLNGEAKKMIEGVFHELVARARGQEEE